MARHENVNWKLSEGERRSDGGTTHSFGSIHAALLMDLRDELRRLRQVFECANFLAIPLTLTAIKRNTKRPVKKRAKEKAR